jgi:antitoxin (DNA-binding transcriptional repressor) of toxin-antitoxin stability system
MSHTVSIQQAAAQLAELLRSLKPGDEIVVTQDDQPVAKIVPSPRPGPRRPGSCRGMLVIHEEDHEHLVDFKDYMP